MTRRLVVCCDGTWNTPDQEDDGQPAPTNVFKLYNCLLDRAGDVEQLKYYHTGVGTEGGLVSRAAGGAYGKGLGRNIRSAYHWLCANYRDEDEIFLFGFSRGAFTVRSLGGMIGACGLLDLGGWSIADQWAKVKEVYEEVYRLPRAQRPPAPGREVSINFIGAWDTVGALGIPNDLAVLNLLDRPKTWRFHDTDLGGNVDCARHAVALDERRASFTPTLWTRIEGKDVKQLWFPGVHSDVGGGYAASGLSEGALRWMIDEAAEKGMGFQQNMVAQLAPNAQGQLHNSVRGPFKALRTRPRNIPLVSSDTPEVHPTALQRQTNPPIVHPRYHPSRTLSSGESIELDVFAGQRWNETHLYLSPGTYQFAATGEWVDSSIKCGPGGTNDGSFQPAEIIHMVSTAWGWAERLYKKATSNEEADFWFTRRVENMPWFCLVGVIANDGLGSEDADDGNPDNDGSSRPHETIKIGDGLTHTVTKPGYLYAFANDAWSKYENNRGSVTLRVTRS